jgi:hypothetical protein
MFDDWKWKFGQPNPEPQMSDFMIGKPTSGIQTQTGALQRVQNSRVYDDGSGQHPGEESGYGITRFKPFEGDGFSWTHDPMANKDRYKPRTYDSAGYNTALGRWQKIEDEKAKQQALFQEMALGTPSQTSAAQGGSVGKPTDLKTSIFDVSSGPKNTMATLEDFNVPDIPFLKRWRY